MDGTTPIYACPGTLVAWAEALDHTEAARLLQKPLDQEKAAGEKLSSLAEGGINTDAASSRPNIRTVKRAGERYREAEDRGEGKERERTGLGG